MVLVLEAKHVRKKFGGVVALADASMTLEKGEVCGLVGANGSGKTTFARIISGLIKPDGGELYINGSKVDIQSGFEAEQFGIALVHQNLSLVPEMTIWENINLGREDTGRLGFVQIDRAINKAHEALRELAPHLSVHERVKNLPPSQKQLVEVAKALCKQPQILILDEPTASLSFDQVKRLFEIINKLKNQGTSIVFISHRLPEVTEICDRLVVFRDGHSVGVIEREKINQEEVVFLITGKREKEIGEVKAKPESGEAKADIVLEVENVSLKDSGERISLQLKRGEIVGLGGLQGQGQEEILLLLSGLFSPGSANIKIEGKSVIINHPRDAIKEGMFLIPGDREKEGLFLPHTVFFNLVYPQFPWPEKEFFLPWKELEAEADRIIDMITLVPPDKNMIVSNLSGGNQQKVVIGKWLAMSPRILLLNDPTKGVDVETRMHFYKIVRGLAQNGTSVLFYSTDTDELVANCDRVLVMFEGRITEEIRGEELGKERLLEASLRGGGGAEN